MIYLDEIRKAIQTFPHFPAASQNILHVASAPVVDYSALEKAMLYDPGMTANILRLANSALFGGGRRDVKTLRGAFVLLGQRRILELVMVNVTHQFFDVQLDGYQLRHEDFLKHSIWVAVASEQFANTLNIETKETLFTAGLLHDIGKLVLNPFLVMEQERMLQIFNGNDEDSFEKKETAVFGINHPEAGGMLFDYWNLPEEIAAAIRYHHSPENAKTHQQLVNIVHIADMLAYAESVGVGIEGVHYHVSDSAFEQLGVDEETLEYVASQSVGKMQEIVHLLDRH